MLQQRCCCLPQEASGWWAGEEGACYNCIQGCFCAYRYCTNRSIKMNTWLIIVQSWILKNISSFFLNTNNAAWHHKEQWNSNWYYCRNTEFEEFKGMWNWKCSLNKSFQVLFSQKYLWLLLHTDYLHDLRKSLEIIYYLGYRVLFEFPATCAKIRQIQSEIVTEIFFFHWIEEAFVACYKPTLAHCLEFD